MKTTAPNGILIIDKPKGITSHDVVNIVRSIFKIKKVGHAGTLDPIATGVLIVLLGNATKRSESLSSDEKQYKATLRLGVTTDTGDAFGRVISDSRALGLNRDSIKEAIMSFKGELEQTPPAYSAVKFRGRSLYKWTRKGIAVPRRPRKIIIKDISVREIATPDVVFDVLCSKGTYIRQLCIDIGEKLGCGAHMTELRRIRAGNFHITQAIELERLKSMSEDELYKVLME